MIKIMKNLFACYSCYYRPTKAFNRAKLGFFLLNPNIAGNKFSYKMFITPKPGLFPIK